MRTTWARAIVRALIASKDKKKNSILCNIYHKNGQVRGFGARARTRSARQSILLIKKMFLDFLIASVAKKFMKMESVENHEKIENLKKFEIFWKFSIFMVFNRFYFHELLSYTSNQVVKKHLIGQKIDWCAHMIARAGARALSASKDDWENVVFL